jgi:hypothetical protein
MNKQNVLKFFQEELTENLLYFWMDKPWSRSGTVSNG